MKNTERRPAKQATLTFLPEVSAGSIIRERRKFAGERPRESSRRMIRAGGTRSARHSAASPANL
jgi:hypothetical protein